MVIVLPYNPVSGRGTSPKSAIGELFRASNRRANWSIVRVRRRVAAWLGTGRIAGIRLVGIGVAISLP
jgi:hypothetical protein